jgi:hypothetical protein
VKRGIMPIYTNKYKTEKYWEENLKFFEFHNTKIIKQKIKKTIKNNVLVEFNMGTGWY